MTPETAHFLNALGIVAVVALVIFFVTRMFWLWYWRIDKIEAHLAEIAALLRSMEEKAKPDVAVKKVSDEKYWPKGK
jgi:hypothetical protein